MGTRGAAVAMAWAVLLWAVSPGHSIAADAKSSRLERSITALDADHDRALVAARQLANGGSSAADALAAAWPSLSPLARRRAIVPLSQLALAHDSAVDALTRAARSDDAELRPLAMAALLRAGARGQRGLRSLVGDPSVGDQAALWLARSDPGLAVEPLLAAMGDEGGAERVGLRRALTVAAERTPSIDRQLRSWIDSGPNTSALASVALALASIEHHREDLVFVLETAIAGESDFATRWRLLQAAPGAGSSDRLDAWLDAQRQSSTEWMLREAAVHALALRGHRDRTRSSLKDASPRVRARSASVLAGDGATMVARATLARRDTWPMVRAAAVASLELELDAMPVVIAAVDDSMSTVREAAILALRDAPHAQGWERVRRRLENPKEWPRVTAAAIEYAAAHCRADAVDPLLRVVFRAARGQSRTEDLNNAARAIEALRALGTPEAQTALRELERAEGIPPTLKIALERPLPQEVSCASSAP